MLNLIKKINLTKKLLTIAEMLSMLKIQNLTKKLKKNNHDYSNASVGEIISYLKNDLFVTAGEVAQDLGISKPFAYKLVRQMNEELEAKGFITIAGRVSRKYYEEKFYGMAQAN